MWAGVSPWLDRTVSGGVTGRDFLARWLLADPYWLYRLDVEFPEPAWAEAEGRVALLQYRIRDQNGYIHRMARCVIPAPQLAVDHLRLRFSHGRSDQAYDPAPGTSSCSGEVVVSGVVGGGLQGMAVAYDDECPSGRCTCDPSFWDPDWAGGHCECYSNDGMCSPLIPLDPIVNDPVCGGWGTFWNSVTEQCECIDSSHEMDAHGDCVATSDPTIPPPDDPPPEPDCSDPLNPECEDGGTNPPPPPPPAEDPMTITLTLSPAEVAPGGVTEVTVQVEPAQAGVPVEVWTSASGDGVGVFGESSDLTDENGVFSTTYTAALSVHVETIWAGATNNDGDINRGVGGSDGWIWMRG
jgi:hypothetical protein